MWGNGRFWWRRGEGGSWIAFLRAVCGSKHSNESHLPNGKAILKRLTLDWNCVIAVENSEPGSFWVEKLINAHQRGVIDAGITAVSAAENQRNSVNYMNNFGDFVHRIERLGLGRETLVPAPGRINRTVVGHTVIQSNRTVNWFASILHILDPNTGSKSGRKRRNAMCDADTLLAHIMSNRDAFITSNSKDFQRNLPALRKLGVNSIFTPEEVAKILNL